MALPPKFAGQKLLAATAGESKHTLEICMWLAKPWIYLHGRYLTICFRPIKILTMFVLLVTYGTRVFQIFH